MSNSVFRFFHDGHECAHDAEYRNHSLQFGYRHAKAGNAKSVFTYYLSSVLDSSDTMAIWGTGSWLDMGEQKGGG
jgi:hypothetical protein